jgi:hypothetical protein
MPRVRRRGPPSHCRLVMPRIGRRRQAGRPALVIPRVRRRGPAGRRSLVVPRIRHRGPVGGHGPVGGRGPAVPGVRSRIAASHRCGRPVLQVGRRHPPVPRCRRLPRVRCPPRVRRRVGDRCPPVPRTRRRGPSRRRIPPPRICRIRRVSRRSPASPLSPASRRSPPPRTCPSPANCRSRASRRSPAAPLITVPRTVSRFAVPRAVSRLAVPVSRIAVPRAVSRIAVPRFGRMTSVLAAARTGPFGAGVTSRAAIRRPRFFLATTLAPRPLSRGRIWLGLRRPSPAQIREPFVVVVVPGAASTPIPVTLVVVAAGSPGIRHGLRNRGPSTRGGSLRGRPLIEVAVLIRAPPAVVLPGLRTTIVRWPGFVEAGVSRPLVRLCLRPS